jgi:hypothetical protein
MPGNKRQYPSCYLPVSPDPPVPALHIDIISQRIFFIELHIRDQTRPRITSFQEVMAQDPVLREPVFKGQFKGIYIIYTLANERTLPEQVLVNIGGGFGIGICGGFIAMQARIK